MQKVLVIGSPGAGKSTLSTRLGKLLNLPVIHLDSHFWQPGWVETDRDIWRQKVTGLVSGDRWIIDGDYGRTFDIRFPAADTIIFLDFPTIVCLWRIIYRAISGIRRQRPDMAPGCPEKVDFEFIAWVWNFRKRYRPRDIEYIERYSAKKQIIILKNNFQTDAFLESIAKPGSERKKV